VPLFRRRSTGVPPSDFTSFWDWWSAEGRAQAERSFDRPLEDTFRDAMDTHVHEVGALSWELTDDDPSGHVLVLRAGEDPTLRPLARRLVLAAPDDPGWTYTDFRPPAPEPESVLIGVAQGPAVDLARVQVSARMEVGRFDVQVHHPAFAELIEDDRRLVTSLAIEAALGEVDAQLWLGEVQPVEFDPIDGFGLSALRSVVHDLKRQRLDPNGEPRWVILRGETADGLLLAMVRSPLDPVTAPHLDTYVSLTLPYGERVAGGQPSDTSLEALRAFEHRLAARLGNDGQVVAHLSTDGIRTFHLYVDSTTGALGTVKDVARSWDEGPTSVHDMLDPSWHAVAHLRQ
jgi:hypothetical protein